MVSINAQTKPRARDLGIPFDGTTGEFNAITDVKGVEVGYATLISGEGKKAIRTGVTAILPQGKTFGGRVFAAWHALNGNGEMTGTTWIEESGGLGSPVMITNTHSVGTVRDAVIEWALKRGISDGYSGDFSLSVVGETYDGFLNDINGFHVKKEHAFQALDSAKSGFLAEGNVGGGTGMIAHGFKGGTGTSSRVLEAKFGGYTVGVLVQANYGRRPLFSVAGVPVGKEITDLLPTSGQPNANAANEKKSAIDEGQGSIIVVVATDAPLVAASIKKTRPTRFARCRKYGRTRRKFFGRYFSRFFDRQHCRIGQRQRGGEYQDAAERSNKSAVFGNRRSDRRSDLKRDGCGGNNERL